MECLNFFSGKDAALSSSAASRDKQHYLSSICYAHIGAIELNLLNYMPLLDPVEKNRLKKLYVEEDQKHLANLLDAYQFMKIVMRYEGLSSETQHAFESRIKELKDRELKFLKKVALRPDECLYGILVKDMNHFLRTCCHPRALLLLIQSVENCLTTGINLNLHEHSLVTAYIQEAEEIIKRIDLWISNSKRFKHHTLDKYSEYYRDFLDPIENSITMFTYGMTGLQHCLIKAKDSICIHTGTYLNVNRDISNILENIIEFPNVNGLNVLPKSSAKDNKSNVNIMNVLSKLENHDSLYFT